MSLASLGLEPELTGFNNSVMSNMQLNGAEFVDTQVPNLVCLSVYEVCSDGGGRSGFFR